MYMAAPDSVLIKKVDDANDCEYFSRCAVVTRQVVAIISITFIVVSTVCLTINTLPFVHGYDASGHPTDNPYLATVETVCIGWFTLEYVGRLWASPNKWQFFKVRMFFATCVGRSWSHKKSAHFYVLQFHQIGKGKGNSSGGRAVGPHNFFQYVTFSPFKTRIVHYVHLR